MVKTITIKDDVYKELLKLKREGKSFSDILSELLERKRIDLASFYGIFKDRKLWEEIEGEIQKGRKGVVIR
ncbi:MAG: antitoxin VapB family protein [Candidatus Bathyarchaeia archaeon]|nr:antitoxin [Candidatus Bathyarchaeota archaeon]